MSASQNEGPILSGAAKIFCQSALLLLLIRLGVAQKYGPDTPLPPGASGKVLPVQGKVVEIKGLASAVAGKSEAVNAALKDLGAKTSPTEIRIALASDVLFDFDKADLLPKAIPDLEKVATVLKSYPQASCSIEGYTDGLGKDAYNQKLSLRRADSVKNWLASHGVISQMSAQGFGKQRPVAPNVLPNGKDNPAGRQKNRRVEVVVRTG
jgi:outer membrane protein OmpA-like peptidoglycan-associated protein